jgi:hypothetical protein
MAAATIHEVQVRALEHHCHGAQPDEQNDAVGVPRLSVHR